eukprot:scaffold74279_cov17-Tisochrysis_lutea.AAC.1
MLVCVNAAAPCCPCSMADPRPQWKVPAHSLQLMVLLQCGHCLRGEFLIIIVTSPASICVAVLQVQAGRGALPGHRTCHNQLRGSAGFFGRPPGSRVVKRVMQEGTLTEHIGICEQRPGSAALASPRSWLAT